MPRRDLITIDGYKEYGLNVFDTVGLGGANNPGDVMTVQAMFRYIYDLHFETKRDLWGTFPLEPDGIAGRKTFAAIREYQTIKSYVLLSKDGIIHPAKYENRNIKFKNTDDVKLMTITLLHLEISIMKPPGRDYTREIGRRYPNVAFWIR